jgi:PAS domain S-box-containing protein
MLSSALVRSVLDSLPDAMIIIDSTGHILFANHQVTQLFGHPNADIVGQPVEVLLPERFRQRHVGHRTGYTDNVRVRPMGMGLDLYAIRKDGSEFPVEISLSPISQDDRMLVAAAIRDVTPRKKAEQAITDARREAEHANRAKSRFLATASHDLRQPLQTLGLLTGALRRMVRDADSQDLLAQQDQAIDAMSRLLNALLDISKLESGAIKLEPVDFDIATLFDEMRRDFASVAAAKGLRLSIDSPADRVHSDIALIGQVLRNLVSNAIKYTERGAVELCCERRGDRLHIEVRDTGVGIRADQVGLIFDEFYQVGVGPNSSREGYGLGLSIVQRIARLLEFDVVVTSVPEVGTVFSFALPIARNPDRNADQIAALGAGMVAASGSGHRVLLVEDEPGVRNAMRMLLKIEGFDVISAATAAEAIEHLRGNADIDLLITDFHLEAGRTGTEVIAVAREVLGASLKAILVSGDTSSAVRELQRDANLRITSKPINSNELLSLVRTLLEI